MESRKGVMTFNHFMTFVCLFSSFVALAISLLSGQNPTGWFCSILGWAHVAVLEWQHERQPLTMKREEEEHDEYNDSYV